MVINLEKLTDLCCKYGITPNQFYILYSIYSKNWKNLYRFKEEVVTEIAENGKRYHGFDIEHELQPLIDKGYLDHITLHENFEIVDLTVTPHFTEGLFIETYEAGEELVKTYPHWLDIGGKKVVAKKGAEINGKYYGIEELKELYAKKIGNDLVKHNWIIEKLKIAIKQGTINFTMREFIYNEMWMAFEDMKDNSNPRENEFI